MSFRFILNHLFKQSTESVYLLILDLYLICTFFFIIKKMHYSKQMFQENVFSASRELLRNVRKHTRKKPFPMMELDGILEANAGKTN